MDQPVNYLRESALPVDDIRIAVENLNNGLNSYIDYTGGAGAVLSEFMGFHGIWYKDLNQYNDVNPCLASGHIHVGAQVSILQGRQAAEASINELINYLNQFIYVLGDINDDQIIDILDIIMVVNFIMGLIDFEPIQFLSADINENGIINILDIIQLVNIILE